LKAGVGLEGLMKVLSGWAETGSKFKPSTSQMGCRECRNSRPLRGSFQ